MEAGHVRQLSHLRAQGWGVSLNPPRAPSPRFIQAPLLSTGRAFHCWSSVLIRPNSSLVLESNPPANWYT